MNKTSKKSPKVVNKRKKVVKQLSSKKGKLQDLIRQRKLAKLLSDDGGKTPVGKLMEQAGYSKAYAKTPQKIKTTLSWKELMEKYLPDDLLSEKHHELLRAMVIDHYVFSNSMSDKDIEEVIAKAPGCKLIKVQRNAQWARAYFTVPDHRSRKDAIDMAYKLKNKYPKGQRGDDVTVHIKKDD